MSDINLLPDELRDKEEKERDAVRKKPKLFSIEMSSPSRDTVQSSLKSAKPSLVSRLFDRKVRPSSLSAEPLLTSRIKKEFGSPRKEQTVVHIPKMSGGADADPDVDSELAVNAQGSSDADQARSRAARVDSGADDNTSRGLAAVPAIKVVEKNESAASRLRISKPKFGWFKFGRFSQRSAKRPSTTVIAETADDSSRQFGQGQAREEVVDVNLIPEDMNQHPELELGRKIFSTVISLVASLLLVVVSYFGLIAFQINIANQAQGIEDKIKILDDQIAQLESSRQEAKNFQQYLNLVKGLLDKHVYWTAFFNSLTSYTIKNVYYSNFSMSGTDKLVITAVATDYRSVAEQLVAFQQATDFIKNVKINAATAIIDTKDGTYHGVNFTADLEFLPGVFLKPLPVTN